MMRYYFLILLLGLSNLIFAQINTEQIIKTRTNWQDFGLISKVKSVKVKAVDYYSSQTNTGFLDNEYFNEVQFEFDRSGNLILRANLLEYGNKLGLYSQEDFVYNMQNKLVEYTNTVIQNGEEPARVEAYKLYKYEGSKLLSESYSLQTKTKLTQYHTEFHYDKNLSKIVDFVEGSKSKEVNFVYNLQNQLVKTELIQFNGQKGLTEYLISNEKGKIIAIEKQLNNKRHYVFEDQQSNRIYRRYFDEKMNLSREEVFRNGELIALKKKAKETDAQVSIFEFDYEYDSVGNWMKCVVKKNGANHQILSREIAYY